MAKRGWKRNPAFKRRIDEVIDAIPKKARLGAQKALTKSGIEAVAIIKGDAPREDGELEDSIDWKFGDPPAGYLGASDPRKDSAVPDDMRISIYAGGKKAPHAHLVHNGTGERETKDGKSTGIMPPQPFFWPNIRSLRRRQKSRITREMRKHINKAVK